MRVEAEGFKTAVRPGTVLQINDRMALTVPSSEAVQEFKVQTTMFDAQNGRSNGGAISFTTRGGTNNLHGNALLLP